jgi:hypothetical protein
MRGRPEGYCDDWDCPALVSCRWHFGRSRAYAGAADLEETCRGPRANFWKGKRVPDPDDETGKIPDSCDRYEFDRPRKWLMRQPWQIVTHVGRFGGPLVLGVSRA